jgi:hypothetical protein
MSPSDDLADVATSVSDGAPVDWGDVERSLGSANPAILRELRVVAGIAEAQRRLAAESAESPSDRPGARHWGALRIEDELGAGAFGNVYRAWDPNLQRDVALKLYRERPGGAGGSSLSSLLGEGRLLARIRHANVAVVHGVEQRGDEVGLWMELVDGRTLAEEVRTSGPLGFREAALVGQDLCRALAAVHLAGLVHRDVKPQNVMRERGGRIVLMDFGIGRDLRESPGSAVTSGTPLYMAPELFQGEEASASSDIYSLGVLLFHLVTQSYPVAATSRTELERAHIEGRRRLLRDVRPDLPDAFVQVVERACAADPARRFATAGAMESALAGVLGLEARASDSLSTGQQAFRRNGVSRRVVWGTAVAAATVMAFGTYVAFRPGQTARNPPAVQTATPAGSAEKSETPATGQYQIHASFFRADATGDVRLTSGGRVRPGDGLFVELQASQPVHVYIVNQDERGEAYLLFPLPGQPTTNPLSATARHRLPSPDSSWQVTSAGEREHFLIVASPEPMTPLETVLATLPTAVPGRPVATAAPIPGDVMGQLRGIGGLAGRTPISGAAGGLIQSAATLSASPESVAGPWMRQFMLENPGP